MVFIWVKTGREFRQSKSRRKIWNHNSGHMKQVFQIGKVARHTFFDYGQATEPQPKNIEFKLEIWCKKKVIFRRKKLRIFSQGPYGQQTWNFYLFFFLGPADQLSWNFKIFLVQGSVYHPKMNFGEYFSKYHLIIKKWIFFRSNTDVEFLDFFFGTSRPFLVEF